MMRLVKPEERGCTGIRSWLRGGVREREHTRVHEDALPSRHGMYADYGMNRFNLLATNVCTSSTRSLSLSNCTMHCRQSLKVGLETGTQ